MRGIVFSLRVRAPSRLRAQREFMIVIVIIDIMILIHNLNHIIIVIIINRKVPSHQPPSTRGKTWRGSLAEAHLDQDALLAERGAAFFAMLWLCPRPCLPALTLDDPHPHCLAQAQGIYSNGFRIGLRNIAFGPASASTPNTKL